MSTVNVRNETATVEGTFKTQRTVTAAGKVVRDESVAAAKTGTLSVRGGNTTGTIALATGHGLATGTFDIYWNGGSRRGVTGTVTGDNMALTGGAGDNLPLLTTPMTVSTPLEGEFAVIAANLLTLVVAPGNSQNFAMWAVFLDDADAVVVAVYAGSSVDAYVWDSDNGATTPFASDIAKVRLSHGDSTSARNPLAAAYVS